MQQPINPKFADRAVTEDADFQAILKQLLSVTAPFLEQQWKDAQSPEQLLKNEPQTPANCDDELQLGGKLFGAFFTDDAAQRVLGPAGLEVFGPLESWRWSIGHIRCCMTFGWLLCRGQRTFRAYAYYLYRYWRCVRESLGTPVHTPLTADERFDFETLVRALAGAYKPFLTDQLANVEFPLGVPEEVIIGRIDCEEGEDDAAAVFERLLTLDIAPALLGKAAFAEHSKAPYLRYLRCWCLASIRFGCCLARARTLGDVLRCLIAYFRAVRECFRPLVGEIDLPAEGSCADVNFVSACSPLAGVTITGRAAGAAFTHYTLNYSWGGGPLVNSAVVYPNCDRPPVHPSATVPVNGGTLGYLDQTHLPPGETEFTVQLDVYGTGGLHLTASRTFKLRTTAVEISAAAEVNALVAPDPFFPLTTVKLVKAVNDPNPAVPELSVGGTFSLTGSAYTVGCDRIMSQFVLARFAAPPAAPVPTPVDASGGTQIIVPVPYDDVPAHPWQSGCFPAITPNIILNGNLVAQWTDVSCSFLGSTYTVPKMKAKPFAWDTSALNGRFVALLEVRDRPLPAGGFPGTVAGVDQVALWIDNWSPSGAINSIGGVKGCGDLHLKDYVGTTAEIRGVAWDPPIDSSAPQQRPNDNFGAYSLGFQKNGGSGGSIAALTPNQRVPNMWPGPPVGDGTLSNWDIVAALDGGPGPLPAGSPKLARGERCAYVVTLVVSDTTHVGDSGLNHSTGVILYAINVINDIP